MLNLQKGFVAIPLIGLTILAVGTVVYLLVFKGNGCLTVYTPTYLPQGENISRQADNNSCPKSVRFVDKDSSWEIEEKDAVEGPKRYQFNLQGMQFEEENGRKYTFIKDREDEPALIGFISKTFIFITNNKGQPLTKDDMKKIFQGLKAEAPKFNLPQINLPKFGSSTFTSQESSKIKSYQRSYPQTLKSTFNPGKDLVDSLLNQQLDGLKEVGFNTIIIYVLHQYDNGVLKVVSPVGGPHFADSADSEHVQMIELAKDKRLAVYLGLEFGGGHNPSLGVPQEQFLTDVRNAALKWARIGEKYQVEFFAPATEVDFHINKEYFTNSPASTEEVVKIVNKFHQDLLPELRRAFKGKLIYQHASFISTTVDGTGYDFVGPDFGPAGMSLDLFRSETRKYFSNASLVAKQTSTNWIIPEFGVAFKKSDKNNPQGGENLKNSQGQSMEDLQDEYFQIFVEEYLNFPGNPKPQGLGIFSYIHPISSIKDRPAEKTVKEFFSQI